MRCSRWSTDRCIRRSTGWRTAVGSPPTGEPRKTIGRLVSTSLRQRDGGNSREETTRWEKLVRAVNRVLRPVED